MDSGCRKEIESCAALCCLSCLDAGNGRLGENKEPTPVRDKTLCHMLDCGAMDSEEQRWRYYGYLAIRSTILRFKAKENVSVNPADRGETKKNDVQIQKLVLRHLLAPCRHVSIQLAVEAAGPRAEEDNH